MFTITPYGRRAFDLFNDFEKEFFNLGKEAQSVCKTDIRDDGEKIVLEMEIPGFEKENINLDVQGDYLTVSAKKTAESESGNDKYIRRERSGSEYQRSFDISNIDLEKIEAQYKNGILFIDLPKRGKISQQTRRLEIR